jgi:DNA-binding NarL/FixJ family response regulator
VDPEEQYAKRLLLAGARGYLKKESAPEELIQAVRKLLAVRRYVSPALAEQFARDLQENADRPAHDALSGRELPIGICLSVPVQD